VTTTTVWLFKASSDAESRLLVLEGLADAGSIQVHDAAAVSRFHGQKKAHTTRRDNRSAPGQLDSSLVEAAQAGLPEGLSMLLLCTSDVNADELRRAFPGDRGQLLSIDGDQEAVDQLYALLADVTGPR
jgi:uncharacterized membrane protein